MGFVEVSRDGRFLSVNTEFCRLLGYERQELLLLGIEDVTHTDDYSIEVQLLDQLIAGKIPFYRLEKRFIRKDGQIIWAEVTRSMAPAAPRKPSHPIGVVLDITERQRAEGILAGLTRQQQALYQLADQLTRTNSLNDVFKAALDAILIALQCDYASILLFDDKNIMRFVAWQGLSDEYRKATDGHSPWQAGEEQPMPICISDVNSSDLSDSLKAVVKREGIEALAFIPLVSDGTLLGKFMIYFDAPHLFTEAEIELSLTIARQLASSVDRKRAEEALRTSEALYRAIAASIPGGGVYVVNKDFRYIVAEGIVTEAFDLTRETLEGHTIYEVLPAEQSAKMRERFEQNFAGETVSYETKHQGRVYWTQQAPLADPADHVIIVTMDITERKQMEEALRESEARFRALLNQATAGIVRKRLDGTLLFVNNAFANMLGYKSSDLVGKPIWQFTHPDDVQINKKLYAQLMLDGLPFQLEKRLIRQDGSTLWVSVSVSPVMDSKGKPQSAVAVEVDITARKQAEEALQELNLQLESLVEKRTAQLKFANDALQKNRRRLLDVQEEERRALARELHDRVGQSLTALNLNLSILQGQLPAHILDVVGSRLADSIGLLDETIPAVRDVMSNLRPTVLDEYGLEAALRMHLSEFTSRHNIHVHFSNSPASLQRVDTTIELTLLRIAQEALFNIAKHAHASDVQLSILQVDSTICFTVEDNGVGFEMSDTFSHRDSHGLNIMRERAEAVGGSIIISSALGKGTSIEVSIPCQSASESELEEKAE
jgi:PAS domain S-box-containing protein